MFGLEYLLAFMQVATKIGFAIVSAIPFYFAWNCIAPVYLDFIPAIYKAIPYWDTVAIFLVYTFLGEQVAKLTPKIVSINQSVGKD